MLNPDSESVKEEDDSESADMERIFLWAWSCFGPWISVFSPIIIHRFAFISNPRVVSAALLILGV